MANRDSTEAAWTEARVTSGMSSDKCVVVPLSRLPQNIGDMLNQFMSGDVTSLHIVGVTKAGSVISTSSAGMLNEVKRNDTF